MFHRLAIYFAPAADSLLTRRAEDWLARPELAELTLSARRYGFHATLKPPMRPSRGQHALEEALRDFAAGHRPVEIGALAPRLLGGFLALTVDRQPGALTDFAAEVVEAFEPFRAPLDEAEQARRLAVPLSARQKELTGLYGYPYVLEEFRFHMTLTDSLPRARHAEMLAEARRWFGAALEVPFVLDRLVLFGERSPEGAFERVADFPLGAAQ